MAKDKIEFSPFVASVFTAMAAQSEATTNQVFDNYERQIADWKADYAKLWDAVERTNERLDSQSLGNILFNTSYTRDRAEPKAKEGQ